MSSDVLVSTVSANNQLPDLWPCAVRLLTAACVAATLQSRPSIIYRRSRAGTRAHRACAAYSILCPGATPDFKLQLAEPEGQVNLQGPSVEVTQTGNNCLSHLFLSFFFLQRVRVQFCVLAGGICTRRRRRPAVSCANVDKDGRFSSGRAADFLEYLPPADQAPLYFVCFSGSGFQSAGSARACVSSGFQARLHRLIKSEHVSPGRRFLITFSLCFILSATLSKATAEVPRARVGVRASTLFASAFVHVHVCACVLL